MADHVEPYYKGELLRAIGFEVIMAGNMIDVPTSKSKLVNGCASCAAPHPTTETCPVASPEARSGWKWG